jgi:hypothetical protein
VTLVRTQAHPFSTCRLSRSCAREPSRTQQGYPGRDTIPTPRSLLAAPQRKQGSGARAHICMVHSPEDVSTREADPEGPQSYVPRTGVLQGRKGRAGESVQCRQGLLSVRRRGRVRSRYGLHRRAATAQYARRRSILYSCQTDEIGTSTRGAACSQVDY